jgi:hypothetical protein
MSTIRIMPVTDGNDLLVQAEVFETCISADRFYQILLSQFRPSEARQRVAASSLGHITQAFESSEGHIFKVLNTKLGDDGDVAEERIIGLSQWFIGYISIAKSSPVPAVPRHMKLSSIPLQKRGGTTATWQK